jgi:hypothetical protein
MILPRGRYQPLRSERGTGEQQSGVHCDARFGCWAAESALYCRGAQTRANNANQSGSTDAGVPKYTRGYFYLAVWAWSQWRCGAVPCRTAGTCDDVTVRSTWYSSAIWGWSVSRLAVWPDGRAVIYSGPKEEVGVVGGPISSGQAPLAGGPGPVHTARAAGRPQPAPLPPRFWRPSSSLAPSSPTTLHTTAHHGRGIARITANNRMPSAHSLPSPAPFLPFWPDYWRWAGQDAGCGRRRPNRFCTLTAH